ncbi:hypothetical protein WMY93_013838 [Mugilogobius chulae]|uniref:Glucoside xylosyltransferase 1 n=1 Tax=Mugilogobius chulae TaxID=88201 RepID=A0AAW0PB81_9GOBI
MRRYLRALLLCMVFAVFSGFYFYSKLCYSDTLDGGVGTKRIFVPQRDPGARRGTVDKTGAQTHWYNRYIMRQQSHTDSTEPAMHLAVVACGSRLDETINYMLVSWRLWSPGLTRSNTFNYTLYSISFPSENAAEWKKLFKPCASQRLFLPLILKGVDSVVYVDSDIIFLQPVDKLWSFLSRFNSTQLAAMAPEHEEPRIAWYNRFARHPYYGRTGINSGVMLMNMTRMRNTFFKNDMTPVGLRWEELLMPLLQKYKLNITWGDQDLLNIIFHYNPEFMLEFPCQWNYRPDHCIYGSNCASAEEEGVYILHGNRGVFHDGKQPAFRAVYEAIQKYTFGTDPVSGLLDPLEEQLLKTTHTYCGKSHPLFTKRLVHSLANINNMAVEG